MRRIHKSRKNNKKKIKRKTRIMRVMRAGTNTPAASVDAAGVEVGAKDEELGAVDEEVGAAGEEVGAVDEEVGAAGEAVGAAGEAVGAAGEEVGAAGEEVGAAGEEVGAAGEEVGAAGEEVGAADKKAKILEEILKKNYGPITKIGSSVPYTPRKRYYNIQKHSMVGGENGISLFYYTDQNLINKKGSFLLATISRSGRLISVINMRYIKNDHILVIINAFNTSQKLKIVAKNPSEQQRLEELNEDIRKIFEKPSAQPTIDAREYFEKKREQEALAIEKIKEKEELRKKEDEVREIEREREVEARRKQDAETAANKPRDLDKAMDHIVTNMITIYENYITTGTAKSDTELQKLFYENLDTIIRKDYIHLEETVKKPIYMLKLVKRILVKLHPDRYAGGEEDVKIRAKQVQYFLTTAKDKFSRLVGGNKRTYKKHRIRKRRTRKHKKLKSHKKRKSRSRRKHRKTRR